MDFNEIMDFCREVVDCQECPFFLDNCACYFADNTPNMWDMKIIRDTLENFQKGWPTRKELYQLMFPTADLAWCPSKYSEDVQDACTGAFDEEGEYKCQECRRRFWNQKVDIRKLQK